jgi:hypothetical protein
MVKNRRLGLCLTAFLLVAVVFALVGSPEDRGGRLLRAQESREGTDPRPETPQEPQLPEIPLRPGAPEGRDASDWHIDEGEIDEGQVREIENAIWRELNAAESRLERIKLKVRALIAGAEPLESERPLPLLRRELPPGDAGALAMREEERHYGELLEREEDLLRRWHALQPPRGGAADDGAASPDKGAREAVRLELRRILREMLDFRESGRERRLERLRFEIEDLERALHRRRQEEERERLVEEELRLLLDAGRPRR